MSKSTDCRREKTQVSLESGDSCGLPMAAVGGVSFRPQPEHFGVALLLLGPKVQRGIGSQAALLEGCVLVVVDLGRECGHYLIILGPRCPEGGMGHDAFRKVSKRENNRNKTR